MKSKKNTQKKQIKKVSKKAKKEPEVIEEFGEVGEVTDEELKELMDELNELEDRDISYGCPKPHYNRGMELVLSAGNLTVFRNAEGILFQLDISLEVEEERVLRKIKVVV